MRAGQETSPGAGGTELSTEAGAGVATHQGPGAGLDTRGVQTSVTTPTGGGAQVTTEQPSLTLHVTPHIRCW